MSGQSGSASDGWEEFLGGLKVMVVDDDPLCLKVVEHMLRRCSYSVTTCINGATALEMLRDKSQHFDLVLSDVYMPDVDGFKLLELIGLELDVPVIMMSSNGETNVVLRGVTHGAVDFLIKPVRIEELRNVWQHVVRRKRDQGKDASQVSDEEGDEATGGLKRCSADKKRKGDPRSIEEERDGAVKKPRVVWSVEMHQQFVNAVNQLGIDKAVPKRILDLMNVEGLTRENVASHLQKYRLYLKRVSGVSPMQGRRGPGGQPDWPPMMGPNMHASMGPAALNMGSMLPGAGMHGMPMSNMNNQQLMQMQLHGMDLQRMNMGMSGAAPLGATSVNPGMHLGLGVAAGAAASISPGLQAMSPGMQAMNSGMQGGPASMSVMQGVNGMGPFTSASMNSMANPGMQRMHGRSRDASDPVLMNSIMSNGLYVDPDPSSHHLAAENLITALEGSGFQEHADMPSFEQHMPQLQSHNLHVQQHISRDHSLSSDVAQNTHLPGMGSAERRSRGSGEESVGNDGVAHPEESMDDILRFFLKVTPAEFHDG